MTVRQATILITEAYSPRNLGDEELVRASIAAVQSRFPRAPTTLVATDVTGFRSTIRDMPVIPRLFDRMEYSQATPAGRLALSAEWVWTIVLLTLIAIIVPTRVRSKAIAASSVCVRRRMRSTLLEYASASRVIAVGGGYLADRYLRESLLTCWTWWFAARIGADVQTMPISVEGSARMLRLSYRFLLRNVGVVVRDSASVRVLARNGKRTVLVPDLAFRNSASGRSHAPGVVVISPVGSDYFAPAVWKAQLSEIASFVNQRFADFEVAILPMHSNLLASAGFDLEACQHLASLITSSRVVDRSEIVSYQDLCSWLRRDALIVISARMHAGIAGLCAGVPTLLLGYEVKHSSLMDDIGLGWAHREFECFSRRDLAAMVEFVDDADPMLFAQVANERSEALLAWIDGV